MVKSRVTVSTMMEVNEEYREKDKIATNATDHNIIRKKRPNPMPRTRGPSSAVFRLSKFGDGADIFPRYGKMVVAFIIHPCIVAIFWDGIW